MKTSELINGALNFSVARALGKRPHVFHDASGMAYLSDEHAYSTDWAQGGPIIDREKINVSWTHPHTMTGDIHVHAQYFEAPHSRLSLHRQCGPTPLIAAMRCFVASKLGDEIEIPEELK